MTPGLSIMLRSYSPADPGNAGWQPMFDRARAADEAGIDRIFVSDHVVFGENMEAYSRPEVGGQEGGRQPTGPDGHWLEPLTVLTALSSVTSRVRLATGILLAGLRRPVVLAKGVPIWVSGTVNKRVLERIVRFGSGWIPWGPAEAEPTTWIPRVHEALAAAGREVTGFQVAGRLPVVTNDDGDIDVERTMDRVPTLVDAGVTDFRTIIRLPADRAAATERLAGIVAAFRTAVGIPQ